MKVGDSVKAGSRWPAQVVKSGHEVLALADGVIEAILVPAEGTFRLARAQVSLA